MVQPRIRGEGDGLLLYGGIDIHDRKRSCCNGLGHDPRMDGHAQHEFASSVPNTFTEAGHLRWVNRQLVLKVRFSAEVLPIGILCPLGNNFFIRQVVGVLQVVQADHQADRDAGSTFFRIQVAELIFCCIPMDLTSQFVQRMALIQHLIQAQSEHV